MAQPSQSLKERTARALIARVEQMGRQVASSLGTPYGNDDISAEEERRRFWLRDPTVDATALWAQGKTPKEISQALYPHRWELLSAGGRITLEEQVKWAEHHARLGPPEGTPEPPDASQTTTAPDSGPQTASMAPDTQMPPMGAQGGSY